MKGRSSSNSLYLEAKTDTSWAQIGEKRDLKTSQTAAHTPQMCNLVQLSTNDIENWIIHRTETESSLDLFSFLSVCKQNTHIFFQNLEFELSRGHLMRILVSCLPTWKLVWLATYAPLALFAMYKHTMWLKASKWNAKEANYICCSRGHLNFANPIYHMLDCAALLTYNIQQQRKMTR